MNISIRRLIRARRPAGDDGTTLIELVVGMMLLSIFLAMFTGAVILMNKATNTAQAVTLSSLQLNQAFLSLDDRVRYASAISTPGIGTLGDWYVELIFTNTGSVSCTQLRVNTKLDELQMRSWTPPNLPDPLSFTAVASGISLTGSAPFVPVPVPVPVTGATSPYQQLNVNLAALSSVSAAPLPTPTFTFTALNSSISAPPPLVCQPPAAGPFSGYRP